VQPQAYRPRGDAGPGDEQQGCACVSVVAFGVLCVLIGAICMYLWLKTYGLF
jgi:hypothetical protein